MSSIQRLRPCGAVGAGHTIQIKEFLSVFLPLWHVVMNKRTYHWLQEDTKEILQMEV